MKLYSVLASSVMLNSLICGWMPSSIIAASAILQRMFLSCQSGYASFDYRVTFLHCLYLDFKRTFLIPRYVAASKISKYAKIPNTTGSRLGPGADLWGFNFLLRKILFNSTLFDCVARTPIVSQSSLRWTFLGVKYANTDSGDSPVLSSAQMKPNLSQYLAHWMGAYFAVETIRAALFRTSLGNRTE